MSELKPFTIAELKKRVRGIPQGEQKQGYFWWRGKIVHLQRRKAIEIGRYVANGEDISLADLDHTMAEAWELYFYDGRLIDARFLGFG